MWVLVFIWIGVDQSSVTSNKIEGFTSDKVCVSQGRALKKAGIADSFLCVEVK